MTYKYYSNQGTSPVGDYDNIVRTNDETGEVAYIPKDEANADYAAFLAAGSPIEGPWNPVNSPDPAAAWAAYQGEAQQALNDADNILMECYAEGIPYPVEWANYRKALKAILKMTSGDPTQPLPTRPADPEGIE